jgi:predicted DNA-binding transcriptional regulator YafY
MRADRLLALLMLLQTRGCVTAQELARELEVSERTIYRDLDALSAAGIPVYAMRGPGGGCGLLDTFRTNLTGLTEEEVQALFMLSIPGPLADLGVTRQLKAALLKLSAALSSHQRRDAEHVRQRIHLDATGWFQGEEPTPYLEVVQQAVWGDYRLCVTYRRGDGTARERIIEPYGLVAKVGVWYLVRAVEGRLGVYRVSRIEAAVPTGDTFQREEGFDLAVFWRDWCADFEESRPEYRFSLRVVPELSPRLEQRFGAGIRSLIADGLARNQSGGVTLDLTVETLEMARDYVLGLGPLAEVLAPPSLREAVARQAAGILARYSGGE